MVVENELEVAIDVNFYGMGPRTISHCIGIEEGSPSNCGLSGL